VLCRFQSNTCILQDPTKLFDYGSCNAGNPNDGQVPIAGNNK
jgi:hypothetical protein